MSKKYEKLKGLLKELFQLDQPDLDFGLYRIMHAKSAEITQFLDKDLLPQVKEEFARHESGETAELKQQLDKRIKMRQELGDDPDEDEEVQRLRAEIAGSGTSPDQLESEVYDHLFSFFRRYYSDGDFLSKRVYKPGVYSIPYEGEEVKLHWANADQYYIKTSEYLRDYAFRLRPDDEENPMRVHFRLADVAEGEHGNVKAAEGKDRVFVLAPEVEEAELAKTTDSQQNEDGDTLAPVRHNFIEEESGEQGEELIIRFEYRKATTNDWPESVRNEKKKPPTQKDLLEIAETRVDEFLTENRKLKTENWLEGLAALHTKANHEKADYSRLRAHLNRYVARNTFDYFIHKDLGGFLSRELDFYVKNEVMHLDDIENETVPRVERYLSKIKVIRRVAGKIIAFLAQLENFQKKLWEKKKIVVEASWLVRYSTILSISDTSIRKRLCKAISENTSQNNEWRSLGVLDVPSQGENQARLNLGEDELPGSDFVSAEEMLVVDTTHFDASFTDILISSLTQNGCQIQGTLVHSENCQALSLMKRQLADSIDCVYIDPPYNTSSNEFNYKDSYRHSSWIAMMSDRLNAGLKLLSSRGVLFCSLDDNESFAYETLSKFSVSGFDYLGRFVWKTRNTDNRIITRFSVDHEYVHVITKKDGRLLGRIIDRSNFTNPDDDERGPYVTDPLTGKANAAARPNLHYVITNETTGDTFPPDPDFGWITDAAGFAKLVEDDRVHWPANTATGKPRKKRFLSETDARAPISSLGISIRQGEGNSDLSSILGNKAVSFPKPVSVLKTLVDCSCKPKGTIVDFFAGSGTTGQAVIQLNREDAGQRRFVLVEMGGYFDSVLLPRIKKTLFSPNWSDGNFCRYCTSDEALHTPSLLKVIRLESYEDAISNLEFKRSSQQTLALEKNESAREQYMLRYMLDVETAGSPSLLNVASFIDPTAYKLKVKRPGSDETRETNVDLIETFNWLIGLTVQHLAAPQCFEVKFERDSEKRMKLKGRLKSVQCSVCSIQESSKSTTENRKLKTENSHWFRTVTGTTPDGRKTLVIWRKRPGGEDPEGVEQDNLVLDEWFTKNGYSSKDSEFDLIYVNGTNNLENLRTATDTWKVRLIEEDFHRLMFEDTE